MKILIKDLEKKLNYKIKKNFIGVGVDTASRTGVCFIKTTKKYVNLDWIFLEFSYNNQEEMLRQMHKEFGKLFTNEQLAVVEEVYVGWNRMGCLRLAKMGTLAVAQCLNKNIDFELISALSARAKFSINTRKYGKGKSKLAVADYLKEIGIEVDDPDISDGVILALLSICEGMDFKPKTKRKKK